MEKSRVENLVPPLVAVALRFVLRFLLLTEA